MYTALQAMHKQMHTCAGSIIGRAFSVNGNDMGKALLYYSCSKLWFVCELLLTRGDSEARGCTPDWTQPEYSRESSRASRPQAHSKTKMVAEFAVKII